MKIPCRKYLFQLHPWPFMCTQMIISSWENSEENVIFLPCFSTEFARYYLTGNKQKIARRTVYFSTSVRPVMFRLWHDHCTSPTFSRKLHLFFYRTHKVLDDTLPRRIYMSDEIWFLVFAKFEYARNCPVGTISPRVP